MILIGDLIKVASEMTGLSICQIKGRSRKAGYVHVRAAIVYIARMDDPIKHSYPQIAKAIGRDDHSTIIHMMKMQEKYAARWPCYLEFRKKLEMLTRWNGPHIRDDWKFNQMYNVDPDEVETPQDIETRRHRIARMQARFELEKKQIIERMTREQHNALDSFIRKGQHDPRFNSKIDKAIELSDERYEADMKHGSQKLLMALLAA